MSTSTRMLWLLSGAFVLTFLFTSCVKKDNIIGGPNNNGSIAEAKFEGETYKVNGLGSIAFNDSKIYVDENDIRALNLLTLSVVETKQAFLSYEYFTILISGYNGPGKYVATNDDVDDGLVGVLGIIFYASSVDDYIYYLNASIDDELEVIIDRDNGRLISGSFSGIGEEEETGVVGPFSGKFVVNK